MHRPMTVSQDYAMSAALLAGGLFVGMSFLLEAGRRLGARRIRRHPEGASVGVGAIDGAVFGLLGLLVAFTFSGAASRFDARRQLIVEETNDIGTAYLRLDLLPASAQAELRERFHQYLDSRLATYRKLPDLAAAMQELARGTTLQQEIWSRAVATCAAEGAHPSACMLLLPALNEMFDITTTRRLAAQTHPPAIIFVMLFAMALASSLLAGYGMASSKVISWVHMLGFAAAMALAVYVIRDIEYPRLGVIRVDTFDQALVELRESWR